MSNFNINTIEELQTIIGRRAKLSATHVGSKVQFTLRGEGVEIDATDKSGNLVTDQDGVVVTKKLFNTNVISMEKLKYADNIALLRAGKEAEDKGESAVASAKYVEYLNKCSITFVAMSWDASYNLYANEDDVACRVELYTNAEGLKSVVFGGRATRKEPIILTADASEDLLSLLA